MRYAILSDIHANESAFRRVLADAKANGAESFVCLGDTVGYGPLPEESVNLVRATCSIVLAGNHDDAVSGRLDPSGFIDLAGEAVQRHRAVLSQTNLDWLGTLPHTCAGEGFRAAHGDFTDPENFLYVENEDDARANFAATDAQLLFVGHTHTPGIFLTGDSGRIYRLDPTDFAVEPGKRYLVNPGSVGYPRERNGRCESTYVLYDSAAGEVTFHALPFAVSSVMQRGPAAHARHRGLVAALLVAGLVALALVGGRFLLDQTDMPSRGPGKEAPSSARAEADLVIKADTVPLSPEFRHFLPNLRLAGGSPPVVLRIRFRSASGQTLFADSLTVRKSRTKAYAIPGDARLAEITLLRLSAGDRPVLAEYNPVFKP